MLVARPTLLLRIASLVALTLALPTLSAGDRVLDQRDSVQVLGLGTAAPDRNRQDELQSEVDRFVQADRAAPPAPCRVLFVGSSSIVKWTTLPADMAPLPVINRGLGGSQIEDVNRWFDQLVTRHRPRAIVFYAGENDVAAGKSPERVAADFDQFMARKSAVLGQTPVYFISLKPSKLRFEQFSLQTQVNNMVRARAEARSDLHYIDVVTPMLDEGKPRSIFEPDGLHMTADGYAIWTQVVRTDLLSNAANEALNCRSNSTSMTAVRPARRSR